MIQKFSHKSLVVQSITCRVTVIFADLVILQFLLAEPFIIGTVTIIRHAVQTVLFWAHEHIWNKVSWGIKFGYRSHARTIIKALVFRFIVTLKDFGLIYLFTLSFSTTIKATVLIALSNTIIYYFHERFWINLSIGRHEFPRN